MFDESKAEVGDILQHRVKGKDDYLGIFISWFSLGNNKHDYAHTAAYVGNGYKVEAHMNSKFKKVKIDPSEYKHIDIWRVKGGLMSVQKYMFIAESVKLYGADYDTVGLVGTTRSTIGKLFNWKWLSNSKPFLNDPKKFFCSEAINRIYYNMCMLATWTWGMIDLAPQISEEGTQPNDISKSGVVEFIC